MVLAVSPEYRLAQNPWVMGWRSEAQNFIRKDGAMLSASTTDPRLRRDLLLIEHDDLDAAIAALLKGGISDDLLITRLKKRKLQLKDEIASLVEPVAQA